MSDVICVTNRSLCGDEEFPAKAERIAACHPAAVILREKDLPEAEYEMLARQIMEICSEYNVPCILHTYADAAVRLGAGAVQLTYPDFLALSGEQRENLPAVGVSVHSSDEAREAKRLGAEWLVAGNIFETDCKDGLPGRGLSFLSDICECVDLPVLAIGGICAENAADVRAAGAAGLCVMSGIMRCGDERAFFKSFE